MRGEAMKGKQEVFLPVLRAGTLYGPDGEADPALLRKFVRRLLGVGDWRSLPDMPAFVQRLQEVAELWGVATNPVSKHNAKTGVPGAYRPVDSVHGDGMTTCPDSCPYRDACYGQASFVGWIQRQSDADPSASLVAAAISMVAAARYRTLSRLQVAGDFGKNGRELDWPYVRGLAMAAAFIRGEFGDPSMDLAFTYTHFETPDVPEMIAVLRAAGIHVRRSDHWEPGGAVVAKFEDLPALRKATGLPLVACPAQLTHKAVKCADCRLCWSQPGNVVVFEPHGSSGGDVAKRAREVFLARAGAPGPPDGAKAPAAERKAAGKRRTPPPRPARKPKAETVHLRGMRPDEAFCGKAAVYKSGRRIEMVDEIGKAGCGLCRQRWAYAQIEGSQMNLRWRASMERRREMEFACSR